ncbi:glycoside hydrolase family 28 protein [Granulicella sp. S190]|uniref:glycoside hydrolase family 28 protein n=1 Tax=Granulicella sp. S190 TaxID=1747226 RepID=UPI00131E3F69|nr:glycosyl hydrolase family 28 protein [Granulicella sp. S190]
MVLEAFRSRLINRRQFAGQLSAAISIAATSPLLGQSADRPSPWDPIAFGACGDGRANDTDALQRTIDACAAKGGGIVALPAGHAFLSGTLILRPHVEFHLTGGSRLLASPNRDDFRTLGALFFAKDSADIHVSGTGTIDGNFPAFFPPKGPEGYSVPQPFLGPYDPLYDSSFRNPPDGRPRMILFVNCRGVKLESFTIRDSPTWTIHTVGCEDLHISGISILNSLDVPNCDGIDIDHCRQVRIEGCNIVAGDDCLVLKASRNFGEYGPSEGITVTNCTLESSSAGIKIETEGPYPLRSAVISNCSIVRSNRGISFLNRDGATVEDLLFTDLIIETKMRAIKWWGSGEPIAVSSLPRTAGGSAGTVRGIQFANIQCRSESGIYLRGMPAAPLRDISFRGVELSIAKTTPVDGGFYDMRPGDAFGKSGLDKRDTAGFFAADVDGLRLDDINVQWSGTIPSYYGAAFELHSCSNVLMDELTGQAAHAKQAPMLLKKVSYAKNLTSPCSPASP